MRHGDRLVLVRHGETAWSASRRHTGRTDVELTAAGRREAERLAAVLRSWSFALALTSPRRRATETARLARIDPIQVDERLAEWDYGDYEGITTAEIRRTMPGWTVWTHPVPGGETIDEVAARADGALARLAGVSGHVLVVSHGHLLRVLAARWLGLPPQAGASLLLGTASVAVLGHDHEAPALEHWNLPAAAAATLEPPPARG